MYNSLLQYDSIVTGRLARLQDALRALPLFTREDYQAAVYSLINKVLNQGEGMQRLAEVRSGPAVVGDLAQNLALLGQDAGDIAIEMLRIENNAGLLFNLAAASQNSLRQLIRKSIFRSTPQQFVEAFVEERAIQPGHSASVDTNAGVATLPLNVETPLAPVFSVGLGSQGAAVNDLLNLSSTVIGTSFQWAGSSLELLLGFPSPAIVNRLQVELDDYDGLEITSLTSSPDGMVYDDVLADLEVPSIRMDITSGKCSGDVILDFPPRMVTQMKLVIAARGSQTGFGLRSVRALKRSYQSSGTLVSLPIYMTGSRAMFSTEAQAVSPFTTLSHQISTDGVNFISIDPGVIETASPFWYQAVLGRSDSAFSQQSTPLTPLASNAAVNAPYKIVSQSTRTLSSGMVEQTITLRDVNGAVVFQQAPLAGSFRAQAGSLYLSSPLDYSLSGKNLTFSALRSLVTLNYQTSALGAAALASLKTYYTPLLYTVRFKAV